MQFFHFSKHCMMGVYQLNWTSVMMFRELMNKIKLWNSFFEGRKFSSFFLCIFRKILCTYKSGPQLQNFPQKNPKHIWESCYTYSHGILSWEKLYSTKIEKRCRLVNTKQNFILMFNTRTTNIQKCGANSENLPSNGKLWAF
jgi:hypothetical protein